MTQKVSQKFKQKKGAYGKKPKKFRKSRGGGFGTGLETTKIKAAFFLGASLSHWIVDKSNRVDCRIVGFYTD